jgi:hypothetical protein
VRKLDALKMEPIEPITNEQRPKELRIGLDGLKRRLERS